MTGESAKIVVTARSRILKFNEGQDPAKDTPVEIVENTHVLEGAEAEQLLREVGVNPSEVIRQQSLEKFRKEKEGKKHAIN